MAVATGKGIPVVCSFRDKYTFSSFVIFSSECVYVAHASAHHKDLKRPKNTIRCVRRMMDRTVAELAEKDEDSFISYDCKVGKTDSVVVNVSFLDKN